MATVNDLKRRLARIERQRAASTSERVIVALFTLENIAKYAGARQPLIFLSDDDARL